ncbi:MULTISPECIES: GNAT family N-acetyltransferase [unclassified Photobacterium]|uniref:GNAT family N-acetyltransferase n=1 Tax=unclassified Photobacterium TaxID=2628852 RepID=UPI001EDEFCAF|nr:MULTISPECIES: GNAT family N-acetyltransferase [unclassified Photobacterium]MCG3863254.1 GNAT family N-acetyltransferase [Photobacterium sp. Ph6]MCG3874784.1 GNAT family N-acetyltransferase [Photobacterium sp. Ph5]
MNIKRITWEQALAVRHQVLWPTKSALFCKVEGDETASHYGAFVNKQLVCVASIYREGDMARLRKFATLVEYQGQGIGTAVIQYIFSYLETTNVTHFWCDARTSAIGFYQHLGMTISGDTFYKSDVEYVKMACQLSNLTTPFKI